MFWNQGCVLIFCFDCDYWQATSKQIARLSHHTGYSFVIKRCNLICFRLIFCNSLKEHPLYFGIFKEYTCEKKYYSFNHEIITKEELVVKASHLHRRLKCDWKNQNKKDATYYTLHRIMKPWGTLSELYWHMYLTKTGGYKSEKLWVTFHFIWALLLAHLTWKF